jgi:hypothetical protein
MATINFITLGGGNYTISPLNNSGLGFFGAGGFANSVSVGAYQDTTFVTDGNGVNQGPQVNNVKWVHPSSGQLLGGTNLALTSIPNYQGTLQIQFLNATACRLQNSKLFIYDRVNTNNLPSGVTCSVSNLIHPGTSQGVGGSGLSNWETPAGSSYSLLSQFANGNPFSPGTSGNSTNGGSTVDTEHDYYVAITASPNSIGSKTYFGLLFSTEFL